MLSSEGGLNQPPQRRIKRMIMTADLLLHHFKMMDGATAWRSSGLPEDARVVGAATTMDSWSLSGARPNVIVLLIESEEFPEVPDAEPYPELLVEFRQVLL
jgi:hypothetical protein